MSRLCRAIWWSWSAATTSRERRRRWTCSKRRWISAVRSPTTTGGFAAERSGLPEATVHGVSTFYDDLLVPRGRRHVRVCTGTACFAATGDAHVDELAGGLGLSLGERSRRRLALAGRDRLPRLLPRRARRSRRRRDRRRPGRDRPRPGGRGEPAPEPLVASLLDEPVLTRPGDWSGLRTALAETTPSSCSRRSRRRTFAAAAAPASPPASSGSSRATQRASRSSSWPTATRATRAPTSTSC